MGDDRVTTHSRRTALGRIAVLVGAANGLAASGLAANGFAASGLAASESVVGREAAGQRVSGREEVSQGADTVHEGYTRDAAPEEGGTITVESRCGETCEPILATGLSPECSGGESELYVDLYGTEPTVWINPRDSRNADIRPGTYRVVSVETCERNGSASEGETLYRVRFRATEMSFRSNRYY